MATAKGSADGHNVRAFFFARARYLGTDAAQPNANLRYVDVILLDFMMPDLDGPATFERLQADPATRGIPVILLTAKLQASDRARFAELGVRAVLPAPFDPMTLSDEVGEILGWSR